MAIVNTLRGGLFKVILTILPSLAVLINLKDKTYPP